MVNQQVGKLFIIQFRNDSNFKNLRILAYRNEKLAIKYNSEEIEDAKIREVNNLNKTININLVVLNISNIKDL